MPSSPAITGANTDQTEEVWLLILKITHPALAEPIRVVNNTENITSNGELYLAAAFKMDLPDDTEGVPSVDIEIDNVDRAITDAVRAISSPPSVVLSVILASTPDVIEAGPFDMTLASVDYNALKVTGTLIYEDILNEPFPGESFNPAKYPGLF